ncbi:MAG: hypothetical protein ACF8QF_08460 [Phycisphaerales bacterium]
MSRRTATTRRALTLLELMLALAITGMIGVGIASTMTMVAAGAQGERDGRSAILRTHAVGVRLHAYLDNSLCVLQHDANRGVALWLQDTGGEGAVNLSEIRIIWWDEANRRLSVERLDMPEEWSVLLRATYNVAVPASSDFFAVMLAQRDAGVTKEQTLMESVESFNASFNAIDVQDATRMDLALDEEVEAIGVFQALLTFSLNDHRRPAR